MYLVLFLQYVKSPEVNICMFEIDMDLDTMYI